MKLRVVVFSVILISQLSAQGQSFRDLLKPQMRSPKLQGPQHLHDYVRDGKLQLSLHDAILLTLENNSTIQVEEAQVENAKFSLLRAYQPFDPTVQSVDFVNRYSYSGFSQVQGPGTFSQLSHQGQLAFSQTFPTGTNIQATLLGNRYSNNSGFYQSSGIGGNQYSLTTGRLMSEGGLGTSLNQLFGFSYPGYGATLTLNLPVRNHAAQAEFGSALVVRRRDLYSEQQVREQITLDVNNAVHQLEEAKLTLEAGKTALDLAEKTLSADQRKYELGSETIFFLLDAQTRVAAARASFLQAQIDYQNAVVAVDYATGNLLESYQVQIADMTR